MDSRFMGGSPFRKLRGRPSPLEKWQPLKQATPTTVRLSVSTDAPPGRCVPFPHKTMSCRLSLTAVLGLNLLLLVPALALVPPPNSSTGSSRWARRAAKPEAPPAPPAQPTLHLQWVREEPPQRPAWPDQPRL